jgi:uncharacterized membrane protein YuzA (DUF378 family)
MRNLDWIALVLIILGGLNWGIVALTGYNVFGGVFGFMTVASRIIYGLIGLASLYMIGIAFTKLNQCTYQIRSHSPRV